MMTVVLFILILSLLVVAHEFGHFIVARKAGMKVYEFGIGFPPRACGWYKDPKTKKWIFVRGKGKNTLSETVGGEDRGHPDEFPATLYSLNWLPLGGFVKIKGENGEDANEKDSFGYHKTWVKSAVLVAGVTMNYLLAALLIGIGFIIGLPTDVTNGLDDEHARIGDRHVVIQQVVSDSPADMAGFKLGDQVLQINDTAIETYTDMTTLLADYGERDMTVLLQRADEQISLSVTPEISQEGEPARLGVVLADAAIVQYPWIIALWKGFVAATMGLITIFATFFILIKGLILGSGLAFEVSGPVGIASIIGDSARLGIQYLINVTAMISLSLAAINILPIPALDGGRLLFVWIEKIIRRPVPMKYEQLAHTAGFLLLMVLIVVVTYRDIVKLF